MDNDTICALATAAGGAIGIIRVSGKEAIAITDRIFRPAGIKFLSEAAANTVHYGEIIDQNKLVVDDVLVSVFRAPHSYTGEDSTEISCHGSRYVLGQVLKLLIDNGCRQAGPGEYTRRAYLNGKMDLSQAEAVADLVAATNRASHHLAISQLKGHFSSELGKLREQLLKMTSLVELELDFSDHEDLEFADRSQLKQLAQTIDEKITRLARSFETGNALKNGIPVAIVGKTNVGKSTLLNQLLHEDKAIVSDIDGTTRDAIEDITEIHGLTFRFIDTAGLRKTDDQVEILGIELTYKKIEEAAIVLWIVDCQPSDREIEDILSRTKGKSLILVRNKIDKDSSSVKVPPTIPVVLLSAKTGTHIQDLEEKLYVAADIPEINENTVIVTSARHYNALMAGKESIERVLQGLKDNLSGDLLSEDLRICLNQLGEITGGQITPTEVLNNIFKHFCIGK
ncbi:MAG: tRNA uridine-5-carboxymethylaminomethyl(34) synthesis GTPase MnmE [Prevotella sp.]|jgi:tRNA modification GTPase|nr:tRNA uridine-5-carboxymethylaminomethyl(34) synthesis GTPase MnmE [uncultured Prevotella sp.]MCI1246252.1 tRNA uridine-5-carboxymethylaminomethyl(34) synthesis GTPase MnmE [Prevotella sp.]